MSQKMNYLMMNQMIIIFLAYLITLIHMVIVMNQKKKMLMKAANCFLASMNSDLLEENANGERCRGNGKYVDDMIDFGF